MQDSEYMSQALALAAKGAGCVAPNPMVGALVVKDDKVVGQGYHQAVGGPHAEVHAIDDAGAAAGGATLYVTLEPCNHQGRTPPCTEKILSAGIKRVVVAMADPNPDVTGGGNARLKAHGIDVVCGVQEEAARQLNESFIKHSRTKLPFVVLKMAATLDGRIATRTGDARWVTGPPARQRVHRMRHAMDAIMVGIGTAAADDPRLTTRMPDGPGVDPIRIVLDSRLTLSEQARMLNEPSGAPTYLVCGPDAPADNRQRLAQRGATIIEAGIADGRIDLAALMAQLGGMGITSILIEGGAQVASSALAAGIVDKLIVFYAPKLLGGDDGIPMLRGKGPALMKEALPVCDVTIELVGEDIMLQGYVR